MSTTSRPQRLDFYRSLISVQQENGRIIIYGGILIIVDILLAIVVANMPPPDVYFVPGAQGVAEQPIYWNRSNADMRRILSGTAYENQIEAENTSLLDVFRRNAKAAPSHAVDEIAPVTPPASQGTP